MLRTTNVLGFDSPLMVVPVGGKTPMLGFFSGTRCVLRISLANMRRVAERFKHLRGEQGGAARLGYEKQSGGNYRFWVRNSEVNVFGMAFEALMNYPVLS